jgi:hypothetical protein
MHAGLRGYRTHKDTDSGADGKSIFCGIRGTLSGVASSLVEWIEFAAIVRRREASAIVSALRASSMHSAAPQQMMPAYTVVQEAKLAECIIHVSCQ